MRERMTKRPTFEQFKKEALQNKEVKAAYDMLEEEFSLLEKSIKIRKEKISMVKKQKKEPLIIEIEQDVADALGVTKKSDLEVILMGDTLIVKAKKKNPTAIKRAQKKSDATTERLMKEYDTVLKKLAKT